ncbi:hypothetical protein M422DRAFT_23158 [Sphaerobolus stellatus SS14]|nr:hypothetical protein M422DRAFT_23158 [Sphaerobolus stellatus SS14]
MEKFTFNYLCIYPTRAYSLHSKSLSIGIRFIDIRNAIFDEVKTSEEVSGICAPQLRFWRLIHPLPPATWENEAALSEFVDSLTFSSNDVLQPIAVLHKLEAYFPNPQSVTENHIHFIVQVPGYEDKERHTKKRPRSPEREDSSITKRQKIFSAVQHNWKTLSTRKMRCLYEQQKRPVLNGRPHYNSGPPVGLFHPVFDEFLNMIKQGEEEPVSPGMYQTVKELFESFSAIYDSEASRSEAITPLLNKLIGDDMLDFGNGSVQCDGVPCHTVTAYPLHWVIKNEAGGGDGDPCNQGALLYRQRWALQLTTSLSARGHGSHPLRGKSYCPSIILAIAGPWLCVMRAVYLEHPVVQSLTDYIWIGGDVFDNDRLLYVSRLFVTLKVSVSALRMHYTDLADKARANVTVESVVGFPYIRSYASKSHPSNKFSYLGTLVDTKEYPSTLIYKVKEQESGRILVVKFVSQYNAEAHRLLALEGLAPELRYAGVEDPAAPIYGKRFMIVMDFIEGHIAQVPLPQPEFSQVQKALQLLHTHGFVFGDLRSPNILITGDSKVKIVDFDWCSTLKGWDRALSNKHQYGYH